MVGGEDGRRSRRPGFVVGVSGERTAPVEELMEKEAASSLLLGLRECDGWVRDVSGVPIGCGSGVDELSGARIFRDGSGGPRREGGS